jgi:pentatricopeptide repeat protein
MLSAYADQGQGEKALHLYEQIQKQQAVVMNDVTAICVLQACSETGCVETCRHLHFLISYAGYDSRAFVVSSLVNAYGCCASMCDAWAVFLGLADPGVAAWNSCISGYAGEGDYAQSHKLFVEMHFTANRPDGPTFTSLISACSHAGLVRKGIEFFVSITEIYGMKSDSKHHVGMVDLLGRAGGWDMVEDLLRGIPDMADISLWLCLLGACRAHGNVVLGKHAFDNAVRLRPMDPAPYVLMSNICCDNPLATWADR